MKTCVQIRQEMDAQPAGSRSIGWTQACAECNVPASEQSCWETCGGSPCCCGPLMMTCDFCEIYLQHRQEIAGMLAQGGAGSLPGNGSLPAGATPQSETSSHPQGGIRSMEKVQFNVPRLWADHHTLKVRAALALVAGVQEVIASPAFRMVVVSYDPALTSGPALAEALAAAGYPVADDAQAALAGLVPVADGRKDPAWDRLGFRVARTDARDVKK